MSNFRYFIKIIIAILISAPIAVIITLVSDYLFEPTSSSRDISEYIGPLFVYPFFYLMYYVILGIPTTLLTDFAVKKLNFNNTFVSTYLISFISYTIAGLVLSDFDIYNLDFFLIPIYTYLHILLFLRRKDYCIY
jgi:hypothetical protein